MPVSDLPKKLSYDDYTVGWVAIIKCEIDAARLLLDNVHQRLPAVEGDDNVYILGDVEGHNVVLAYPAQEMGLSAATRVTKDMIRTFRKIRIALLVGIAGGAPGRPDSNNPLKDIRLGDVVVSCPQDGKPGVLQVDFGKQVEPSEFITVTGKNVLNHPPNLLLAAVNTLKSEENAGKTRIGLFVAQSAKAASAKGMKGHCFPGWDKDQLFESSYSHVNGDECSACDPAHAVVRLRRASDTPAVHYGVIASGNAVVRSSQYRDRMRERHGILCFEMEAAGMLTAFPCLVIRGICDYSDAHKHKIWQPYAATTAASYARNVLRVIQPEDLSAQKLASEVIQA